MSYKNKITKIEITDTSDFYIQDPDSGYEYDIRTLNRDELADLFDRLPTNSDEQLIVEKYNYSKDIYLPPMALPKEGRF